MKENIYPFPDRSTIEEEAAAWLIKLDGDTGLSEADQRALRKWLIRSPLHREELDNLAAFWGQMNVLTELAVRLGKPETQVKPDAFNSAQRVQFSLNRAGVAAAVLVLGIAIVFTSWFTPDSLTISNGLYTTVMGQQQTATLVDGSEIQLNTNSQLVVAYNEQYRNVYLLQGEAYFSVARNPDRQFRVYAGNGRIQAVGTAFSVRLKDQDVEITVTQGRVMLASFNALNSATLRPGTNNEPLFIRDVHDADRAENLSSLEAGQSTTIKRRVINESIVQTSLDAIQTIDQQEMARRLSWRQGLLIFAGETLEEVVDKISRYSTVSIDILEPEVRAIKIGGQFRIGETEAMFDALEENFGLHVTRISDYRVQLTVAKKQ